MELKYLILPAATLYFPMVLLLMTSQEDVQGFITKEHYRWKIYYPQEHIATYTWPLVF